VLQAATQFFDENFVTRSFPSCKNWFVRLQRSGCDVWAVSSTNEWAIRAAMKHFGIDDKKILAAAVTIENGRITDQLIRVPSGEGKPRAIRDVIGKNPDAAFGNSRWDAAMLRDRPAWVRGESEPLIWSSWRAKTDASFIGRFWKTKITTKDTKEHKAIQRSLLSCLTPLRARPSRGSWRGRTLRRPPTACTSSS
jgi:hypothetical protein